MQLLGHLALGYFSGAIGIKYTNTKVYLPMLWICALAPDIDFLFSRYIAHRGPTHSILVAVALFVPIFLIFKKNGLPYFTALASHTLIGDFFIPSEQLLWPISKDYYGAPSYMSLAYDSASALVIEMILFTLMLIVMGISYQRHRTLMPPTNKRLTPNNVPMP